MTVNRNQNSQYNNNYQCISLFIFVAWPISENLHHTLVHTFQDLLLSICMRHTPQIEYFCPRVRGMLEPHLVNFIFILRYFYNTAGEIYIKWFQGSKIQISPTNWVALACVGFWIYCGFCTSTARWSEIDIERKH